MKKIVHRIKQSEPRKSIMDFIGRHDFAAILVALACVVGIWLFIGLTDEVLEGDTKSFDQTIYEALLLGDVPGWYLGAWQDITALGGLAVLIMLSLVVAIYLAIIRKYGAMWMFLIATGGGVVLGNALKYVFDRARPGVELHMTHVMTPSFPSAHALMSATVYLTLGVLLARLFERAAIKAYFITVALLLTFLIGISRVMLGVHHPTDVLGGWALGLSWAAIVWLAARWLQQRGIIEKPHTTEEMSKCDSKAEPVPT